MHNKFKPYSLVCGSLDKHGVRCLIRMFEPMVNQSMATDMI